MRWFIEGKAFPRPGSVWVFALALGLVGCPAEDDDAGDDDTSVADDDTGDDDTGDDDSGDDDSGDDDSGDDDTAPPCGFHDPASALIEVGESYVEVAGWSSRVSATVFDGPYPPFHGVVLEQGDCRYLQFLQGFCDPPCDYDQFCDADSVCHDYPTGQLGGTLTVTGLGDDLVIEPEQWTPGYYFGPWDLPPDLFDEGDPVGATLAGDVFPAVSLHAAGVAALDPSFAASLLPLVDGQDNEVTWTAGDDPAACVRLLINGANDSHGLPLNDILWCETADTGSLVVPQPLVEAFPLGATPEICVGHDCPPSQLVRYRRDETTVPQGLAVFEVTNRVYFGYDHHQ